MFWCSKKLVFSNLPQPKALPKLQDINVVGTSNLACYITKFALLVRTSWGKCTLFDPSNYIYIICIQPFVIYFFTMFYFDLFLFLRYNALQWRFQVLHKWLIKVHYWKIVQYQYTFLIGVQYKIYFSSNIYF